MITLYLALLAIHIITLVYALAGASVASLALLTGKFVSSGYRISLLIGSLVGVGTGGDLLIYTPSPASCIKLAVYLFAFVALYTFIQRRSVAAEKAVS